MKTKINILLLAVGVMLLASCKKKNEIDPTLLPGVWQFTGTEQYLNFHQDNTGAFWDEAEDIYEDDIEKNGNGWFTWALAEDQLALKFTIEVSGGSVPKNSTITELTTTTMTWQDSFKNKTHFTRKK
ncbi:MAG TPA: hypothetical protein DEO38_00825 [Bacteroidales bacterium]|jgi:hypothetical protein|nr:hypothetical protein [Bacteroidales bacterium]